MKVNKRGLILINKMIGTKSFLIKTLPLVLIVFSVFTITLSDNLELADGLAAGGDKMIYELNPGESQMLTWLVINDEDKELVVEFYSTGPGSELLIFEQYLTLEPKSRERFEIFVVVPEDHETDLEFRPSLFVLHRGDSITAGAGIQMNIQMEQNPIIRIGDNPIYTYPVIEKEIEDEEEVIEIVPEVKTIEEKEQVESLEDKLKRIQAANEATKVDDDFEESFEEEAVPDYQPEPEYELEPKDIVTPTEKTMVEEKKECNFIDWLLSLFGIGTCE